MVAQSLSLWLVLNRLRVERKCGGLRPLVVGVSFQDRP